MSGKANIQLGHNDDPLHFYHQLHKSTIEGNIEAFTTTLKKIENSTTNHNSALSRLTPQGNTILHIAASFGHKNLSQVILEQEASLLSHKNYQGDTPLHIAAKAGNLPLIKYLVQFIRENGTTNLDTEGNRTVGLLKEKNKEKSTALHEALINGHESVAKFLIEADASICYVLNKEEDSPLYLAAGAGYVEIVKLIKENVNQIDTDNLVRVRKSPLFAAIQAQKLEIVEIIASMGIYNDWIDEEGRRALRIAVSTGYLEAVLFLLDTCLSDFYQSDKNGDYPIHEASSKGHINIIKEFLRHCPDCLELQNNYGENILHVAAKCGKNNVVSYVLKQPMTTKLIVNQKDKSGNTALHLAVKNRHPLVVNTFTRDRKINLNLVNNHGLTALDIAEKISNNSFQERVTWMTLISATAQQRAHPTRIIIRKRGWASRPTRRVESFKDRVNTLLLVATLVATVTFAAGFTMPGGYNSSDGPSRGMATMLSNHMFQVFVICDSIAMYSSILVAVTLVWAQLGHLNLVRISLYFANWMLAIALTMFSLAFMAGVYLTISNLRWLAILVLIMGITFLITLLLLVLPFMLPIASDLPVFHHFAPYVLHLAAFATSSGSTRDDERHFMLTQSFI